MRPRNDLWQGNVDYWQYHFIQQNLLVLGYAAWSGYLNHGRGVLRCELAAQIPAGIDWQVERVEFRQQFLPQGEVATYWQGAGLEPAAIVPLLPTLATYDPSQALIIILLQSSGHLDINLLQPKIPPPSCYEQVQRRWAEFQPDCLQPPGRFYA